MALIKCPNCEQEISDKCENCIHCGHSINDGSIVCDECGTTINKGEAYCSKCGCPRKDTPQRVELAKVNLSNKKVIRRIIIGSIITIIAIATTIIIIVAVKNSNAESRKRDYESNIKTITKKILDGAAEAENCGNMIKSIWYNTIYEKEDYTTNKYTKTGFSFNDDFNDSLSSYFRSDEYGDYTSNIKKNKREVSDLMKKLKNPPDDWDDAYHDLKDYYNSYLTLTNMCLDPSGNLTTYSSNFNSADTETYNNYEKMKSYFDD